LQRDIRETPLYREIEEQIRRLADPVVGELVSGEDPQVSPDGNTVALTGRLLETWDGDPVTRIALVDLASGRIAGSTSGPNSDRSARWSPDGAQLAFLSDREKKGQAQLYLVRPDALDEATQATEVDGAVEYLSWSPDGSRILLGVAGRAAEIADAQGSGSIEAKEEDLPSWMPTVDAGVSDDEWRRAYLFDVSDGTARPLSRPGLNVWEAVWAGPNRLAAVVSEHPGEAAWYTAPLALIDAESGQERVLYRSAWQLGYPASAPSGARIAIIEGVASDRLVVAGELLIIDAQSGKVERVSTSGVDVTFATWLDERRVLIAGARGLHSVVGEYDTETGRTRELWDTSDHVGSRFTTDVAPVGDGDFLAMRESHTRYPELARITDGTDCTIYSFEHASTEAIRSMAGIEAAVSWQAPDGWTIEGYLIRPEGDGPFPLVLLVHGGPVSMDQTGFPATTRLSSVALLVARGYALLLANPRGSWGRGQEFARAVYGDMGGADTHDLLCGVDAMVDRGIADPDRLGVMGGSYGGYMTSWLVTQTDRFAAAVSLAPVNDWYSFHWTSNLPYFDEIFLQDSPFNPSGLYYQRSPVYFANRVRTPTLNVAGGHDLACPPSQAQEFHQALLENGVRSELVIYPEEGHGVRKMPAALDLTTRIVGWFEEHMPPALTRSAP
jgi:dipeptidyl aminopeptidase/acylaminoacyl peptidase